MCVLGVLIGGAGVKAQICELSLLYRSRCRFLHDILLSFFLPQFTPKGFVKVKYTYRMGRKAAYNFFNRLSLFQKVKPRNCQNNCKVTSNIVISGYPSPTSRRLNNQNHYTRSVSPWLSGKAISCP